MEPTHQLNPLVGHPDWVVQEWRINFLLCDELLDQAATLSREDQWYDDSTVDHTWMTKLSVCFTSVQQFYTTFGTMPQIGDRLLDEKPGLLIVNRSINGESKQLTFTLCPAQ